MGSEEVERIKQIFQNNGSEFQAYEHEPVHTSEDAARVRKSKLSEGVKAIVVKQRDSQNFYVADVAADKKVDLKKLAEIIGVKALTMAKPEEVLTITGCEVGGVPPLGHKTNIPIFVDNGVFENEYNEFNAGLKTYSVRVKTVDFKKTMEELDAKVVEIAIATTK